MVNLSIFTVFLKNGNFISKIRISKVTEYAALTTNEAYTTAPVVLWRQASRNMEI